MAKKYSITVKSSVNPQSKKGKVMGDVATLYASSPFLTKKQKDSAIKKLFR